MKRKKSSRNIVIHDELERDVPRRRRGLRIKPNYRIGNCEFVWHDGSILLVRNPTTDFGKTLSKWGHFIHKGSGLAKPEIIYSDIRKFEFNYRIWTIRASYDLKEMVVNVYRNDDEVTPYDGPIRVAYERPERGRDRFSIPIELYGNEKI